MFDKIIIPVIKHVSNVDLKAVLSCQPMTGGESYSVPFTFSPVEPMIEPKEGDRRHSIVFGWQVFYGDDWIPERAYLKIKIAGM